MSTFVMRKSVLLNLIAAGFLGSCLVSGTVAAFAQDAATQQAQILVNQQNQILAQQAAQQAAQNAQMANDQALASASYPVRTVAKPRFSLKPGAYPAATVVRIRDANPGATIYYTTDGWTPTVFSTRYTGSITLSSTTTLQAIAVVDPLKRSLVASAVYTLPKSAAPVASTAVSPLQIAGFNRGTPLPFVFTSTVTSKSLRVGDTLPVALAEDLAVDGKVVAPKGTPAVAVVTGIDATGLGGAPASMTFAMQSITVDGKAISLSGTETKEGEARVTAARSLMLIPFVGMSGVLVRGQDAEIPQGATLTALVEKGPGR